MPLNAKATKILKSMIDQYGADEGERVFYATANKQKRVPETWEKKASVVSDVLGGAAIGGLAGGAFGAGKGYYDYRNHAQTSDGRSINRRDFMADRAAALSTDAMPPPVVADATAAAHSTPGGLQSAINGAWKPAAWGALAGGAVGLLRWLLRRNRRPIADEYRELV